MNNITYVALRNDLLVRLIKRDPDFFHGLIEYAVEDYLDRTEGDCAEPIRSQSEETFYWGNQLVLPQGTLLRTKYRGRYEEAEQVGGGFSYNGISYASPAKVCNAMRGGFSNNAWKMLEIKRPNDVAFRPAESFRK